MFDSVFDVLGVFNTCLTVFSFLSMFLLWLLLQSQMIGVRLQLIYPKVLKCFFLLLLPRFPHRWLTMWLCGSQLSQAWFGKAVAS